MDMSMIVPTLFERRITNRPEMIGGQYGLPNTGNTFNKHVFVVATAGVLAAVASAGTSSCGLCLDASTTVTVPTPPDNLLGGKHFPVALQGQRFAVSVTDSSGHVGQANGAPQMSGVTVGSSYGILKLSNGNHALNVSDTSNLFFIVVEKPDIWNGIKQDANTYNPVVIVEVVSAAIQNLG
jgi:hypothetical protein